MKSSVYVKYIKKTTSVDQNVVHQKKFPKANNEIKNVSNKTKYKRKRVNNHQIMTSNFAEN